VWCNLLECCTFKWSDGRTVETIGAPPMIHHTDRLQQLSYCNCHLRHCLGLPPALNRSPIVCLSSLRSSLLSSYSIATAYSNRLIATVICAIAPSSNCPEICVPIHREILTQSHPQNNRLLFCLSAKTNTHNVQEPIQAPVHISPHQQASTSEPRSPVIALPKQRKIQKQPKTYPPQPKTQQQKWL
jgi:hypothetical protein